MERIVPIEQTDDPASPPVLFHGHTTTPADQSPRLLSSAGTSVATTAVDYDLSFHELMDAVMGAELMSVNELENLWATSNPADDASHAAAAAAAEATAAAAAASTTSAGLPTIPETPDEDTATSAGPSRLTQRLLALSTTDASGQKLRPGSSKPAALSLAVPVFPAVIDTVEPTAALVDNTSDHEEPLAMGSEDGVRSSKVILPDPFADIPASAMVDTTVAVSPRAVLTIVETVPVYMTVVTTTEPAGDQQGKWIVRRHRLLRLVENGYVNASSLLLAGGVSSAVDRSTVMSLEVGRFKWRRPQSKLYGTWIPLPRARALAATCSLNHKLGPFLNDNLESYFPAPLPTSFVRHVITPFFTDPSQEMGLGFEFQNLINSVSPHPSQSISRSSTFGATARGTPSPSIIQALSKSSSSYNAAAAAAAKAMFSSDPRHLQSFLQLLSADGPMLGTSAEAMAAAAAAAMAAVDEDCLVEQQQPPPPSPAAESKESTGGVDAQCLSEAIASTMTQPTPVKKDPEEEEEEENDDDGPELDDGDGLDLMSMVIPGHDIDMICSSTPPSPPPPPPTTPPRLRRSSTADGSSQAAAQSSDSGSSGQVRRAAGLNARLAQTMEAFGLSGAAKASLLLRLRAAAASTSTGRPQAVAPYLLYRSTAAKRKDESSVGVRKRARVVRVARSKPGEAEALQQPPPPPPKRMIDAAAILRVACAIYSQKLNAGMQPPQPQQPEPPQPRPAPRPQNTVRPAVRPVRPAVTPQRPLQPVSSPAKRLSPLISRPPLPSPQARPGTTPVRRPMNGFQPRPPMSQPGGVPLRRPAAPFSGRPPLMRPPLRPPPPNGQLRPRPALPANGTARPPPLPMRPATAARPPLTPIKSPLGARPPPYSTPLRPGGMRPIMRPQPPKTD
ncbi:hypothetical protein IW146_003506 [Coemansia sp. RSA 922]|nr:hypothetical protein IW146_003506 [Coemansia sp. RSA 922]